MKTPPTEKDYKRLKRELEDAEHYRLTSRQVWPDLPSHHNFDVGGWMKSLDLIQRFLIKHAGLVARKAQDTTGEVLAWGGTYQSGLEVEIRLACRPNKDDWYAIASWRESPDLLQITVALEGQPWHFKGRTYASQPLPPGSEEKEYRCEATVEGLLGMTRVLVDLDP